MSKSIVEYMNQGPTMDNLQKTLQERTPQFIASVASLVSSNPKIAECSQRTVLSACLVAASLDLPINQNLGFAYIIPYNVKVKAQKQGEIDRYEQQAQFQMGWKGFIQLAIRTGKYKSINVREVREGEMLGEDFLSGEIKFEWAKDREKLPIVGYIAYFKLLSGFEKMAYMTVKDLEKHGMKYSKSYKYGQWTEDPDAMMKKTMLKLLISKFGPMSSALEKAIISDQATIDNEKLNYIDNGAIDPTQEGARRETERVLRHIENAKTPEELEMVSSALEDQNQSVQEKYTDKMKELSK